MSEVGDRIRDLRKAKGLTQVGFAKSLGINQSTLSAIENGAGFGSDILMAISDELEVSAELIMRGADPLFWPLPKVSIGRFLALSEEDRGFAQARLIQAIEECEQTSAAVVHAKMVDRKTPYSPAQRAPRLSSGSHEEQLSPPSEETLFQVRTGAKNEGRSNRTAKGQGGRKRA